MTDDPIPLPLVQQAQNGDRTALEAVLRALQDRVHRLALRMLADPEAAQDATQEILIRIMTKLSTFQGGSRFETWAYRLASNHLLNVCRKAQADHALRFDDFAADLETGLVDAPTAEDTVMLNQLRITCTMAMLLCLDPDHRAAYVLGEIFEMDQSEACAILDITNSNFRKRLSRARKEVQDFTARHCGLAQKAAKCRCPRRLPAAVQLGRVQANGPAFDDALSYRAAEDLINRIEQVKLAASLQRATGALRSPVDLAAGLSALFPPPP